MIEKITKKLSVETFRWDQDGVLTIFYTWVMGWLVKQYSVIKVWFVAQEKYCDGDFVLFENILLKKKTL